MLPLAGMAQTSGTNTPDKTGTEMRVIEMPEIRSFQKSHGCGDSNPTIHLGPARTYGTLYIIDGVKIETVQPVSIEPIKLKIDMNNPTALVLQRRDISTLPYTDLTDMVSLSPSAYQQQRGAANHISGGRTDDVLYIIDGMQIARR